MSALRRALRQTGKLLSSDSALWFPFLLTAFFEVCLLTLVWLAPHSPFSGLLAPPLRYVFGNRILHYPWNVLFLYHAMRYSHDVATLLIGAFMSGIACAMVRQKYEGQAVSVSAARRSDRVRYGTVVVLWIISWILARVLMLAVARLIKPEGQFWITVGATVFLQALVVYAIPAAVFASSPWWKALWQGVREAVRYPLSTLRVLILPLSMVFVFSLAASPAYVDRGALHTTPELALAFVALRLCIWTVADAVMTVGVAHLWWAHRTPAKEPAAKKASLARSSAGAVRWLALLAGCLGLAVVVPMRDRSYIGERLLWKAQRLAATLPSALQATQEQAAQMRSALEQVISKASGTRSAVLAQVASGSLHAMRGEFPDARDAYTQAISWSSGSFPDLGLAARVMTAKTYEAEKDWTHVAQVYAEIAERYPWSSIGLGAPLYAASVLAQHGKRSEARQAYQQAIERYTELTRQAPTDELQEKAQRYLEEARKRLSDVS